MNKKRSAAIVAALAVLFGCGGDKEPVLVEDIGDASFVSGETEFSAMVFGNGEQTLNDRCIVRQAPLNLRMPPVYVNSRPVGFC